MKISRQSVKLFKHDIDPYKFIEKCARTCYKSEDKITDESAVKMVTSLAANKHLTTLEHEYVYFWLDDVLMEQLIMGALPEDLRYIQCSRNYISGSFRAFLELFERLNYYPINKMKALLHVKYPEVFKEDVPIFIDQDSPKLIVADRKEIESSDEYVGDKMRMIPHTFKFVTNRAVANELTRHRANIVFSQESTRYVDYGNDKNDHQITVIAPDIHATDILNYENWHYAMLMAETQYMNLRKGGIPAEIARGVLPLDLKTEIVVTATEEEWQHIVDLRYHGTTGRPHPQIKELIGMAYPILQEESNGRIK